MPEPYFVAYEIDTLAAVDHRDRSTLAKASDLFLKINSFNREPDGSWLLDLEYESNIGSIDVMSIWEALNEGKRHLFSSAGLILLKIAALQLAERFSEEAVGEKRKKIRLTTLEWIKLFVFEEIKEPEDPQV